MKTQKSFISIIQSIQNQYVLGAFLEAIIGEYQYSKILARFKVYQLLCEKNRDLQPIIKNYNPVIKKEIISELKKENLSMDVSWLEFKIHDLEKPAFKKFVRPIFKVRVENIYKIVIDDNMNYQEALF